MAHLAARKAFQQSELPDCSNIVIPACWNMGFWTAWSDYLLTFMLQNRSVIHVVREMNAYRWEWKTKWARVCFHSSVFNLALHPKEGFGKVKLRKCVNACVCFRNNHPCFGCSFPGETREVFPSPCTQLWQIDVVCTGRKEMLTPKLFPISLRETIHNIFFLNSQLWKLCFHSLIDGCVWWSFLNWLNGQVSEIYRQLVFV